MTALFSARRRAEEFQAAVESPHREVADDLRPLVELAGALHSGAAADERAKPRPDFAADLRARLLAEAEDVLTPGSTLVLPTRTRGRREQRLVAAAAAAVLLGGTAGVAAASQDALPGDTLYPVKRGIERAEAGLSVSDAGKGRDLLHHADGRLEEVRELLADDSVTSRPRVPQALADFTDQADQGATLLLDSYRQTREPGSVETVRSFAADGVATLEDLARTAPPEAQEDLTRAALALREIDARASRLCPSCADLPTLEIPGILLVASEAGRALTEVDPRGLDNSHPVLVPKGMLPDKEASAGRADPAGTSGEATGGLTDDVTDGLTGGTTPAPGSDPSPLPRDGSDVVEKSEQQQKKLVETTKKLGDSVDNTVGGTVGGVTGPVGGAGDGTVGQITDGLNGVVETLLPDPQSGSLLP